MKVNIYKVIEWFKSLFKKRCLVLNAGTNIEYEENRVSQKKNFKEELRTIESEEEKDLIKKFESGEMPFNEITEDILNKISKGYSLQIKRNMEIISKLKSVSN